MMEGVNLSKIYYKHICKYHNISPEQLLNAIKINDINVKWGGLFGMGSSRSGESE
jgi:hypothetical protein